MDKESKAILGQWIGNKLYLTDDEKRIVVNDYLSGNETCNAVFKRYTGYSLEHGRIAQWMKRLGIDDSSSRRNHNFTAMGKKKVKEDQSSEAFEIELLKNRIKELESKLEVAEMKAIAFSTMVDIAEKEFKIPIRKKYDTKSSKK